MNFSSVVSWATWISISPIAFLSWLHSQGMPVKLYRHTYIKKLSNKQLSKQLHEKAEHGSPGEGYLANNRQKSIESLLSCTVVWFSGASKPTQNSLPPMKLQPYMINVN